MSETSAERLYNLLPTIYRQRDQLQGEPLRALMAALESEYRTVEADIDTLYDNWFIETCAEWVVPYLADLVGVQRVAETQQLFASQRRQVANTIAYRRRKGTIATLEHVAQDMSDWPVCAVAYEHLLALTQNLATVQPEMGRLADLRRSADLAALEGPFDTTAHTIDVRQISAGASGAAYHASALPGKYQPDRIGLFIWRLQPYPMITVPAAPITQDAGTSLGERSLPAPGLSLPPDCFTFDPLGRDMPLFTQPQPIESLTHRAAPINLPDPISRTTFARDLQRYRERHRHILAEDTLPEEDQPQNSAYYGPDRSLCVILNGRPILPQHVIGADLSRWRLPLAERPESERMVAIDVALGRLMFLGKRHLAKHDVVEVNYSYGFSADLGGGPYIRDLPLDHFDAFGRQPYRINVLKGGQVDTLQKALAQWNAHCASEAQRTGASASLCGVIHIVDNSVYAEPNLAINLPRNSQLIIEADNGYRPIIHPLGDLTVTAEHAGARLVLDGLLIDGPLTLHGGMHLDIAHCTLMPHGIAARHEGGLIVPAGGLHITIDHSIVGPIHLQNRRGTLAISASIVDHARGDAIDALTQEERSGPIVTLNQVTIFGKVRAYELQLAQDVIFTAPIFIRNQSAGLVSCSYVPPGSQTPRRDRCQPDLARAQPIGGAAPMELDEEGGGDNEPGDQDVDWRLVIPLFTSTRYGDPAYTQLSLQCAPQIRRGAADGSEMGAFHDLRQTQRQDNLFHALQEYLPYGLEAGYFYVT
jgi:hypothetical protein